jgi:hypothetical protein
MPLKMSVCWSRSCCLSYCCCLPNGPRQPACHPSNREIGSYPTFCHRCSALSHRCKRSSDNRANPSACRRNRLLFCSLVLQSPIALPVIQRGPPVLIQTQCALPPSPPGRPSFQLSRPVSLHPITPTMDSATIPPETLPFLQHLRNAVCSFAIARCAKLPH